MSDARSSDDSLDPLRRAAAERPDDLEALGAYAKALREAVLARCVVAVSTRDDETLAACRDLVDVVRRLGRLDEASSPALVEPLLLLGKLHCWRSEHGPAQTVLEECLRLCRRVVETDGAGAGDRDDLADTLDALASIAQEKDDLVAARALRDEALPIRRSLAAEHAQFRELLADALGERAELADKEGRSEDASEIRDERIALLRTLVAEEPDDDSHVSDLASALEDRARGRGASGDAEGARADAEETAAILRVAVAERPEEACELAVGLELLVDLASDRKEWAAGLQAGQEWARVLRRVVARGDKDSWSVDDLGRALQSVAEMRGRLNDPASAVSAYEEALAYNRGLAAADPTDSDLAGRVAELAEGLAVTVGETDDTAGARRLYAEMHGAYLVARRLRPEDTDLASSHRWGLERAARFHERVGDLDAALAVRIEQLGIARSIVQSDPSTDSRDDVRFDLIDLGDLYVRRGEREQAAGAYREAVAIARGLAAENPQDRDWLVSIAHPLAALRNVLEWSGAHGESLSAAREVVSLQRSIVTDDPTDFGMLRELLVDLDELGDRLRDVGDHDGAAVAYEDAESIARGLVATDGSNTQWRDDLHLVLRRRAGFASDRGDATAAVAGFAASVDEARVLVAQAPDAVKWRRKLGESLAELGASRSAAGDHGGALAAYEEAVALLLAVRAAADGPRADSLRETLADAADAASAAGRPDRAVAFRAQAGDGH